MFFILYFFFVYFYYKLCMLFLFFFLDIFDILSYFFVIGRLINNFNIVRFFFLCFKLGLVNREV